MSACELVKRNCGWRRASCMLFWLLACFLYGIATGLRGWTILQMVLGLFTVGIILFPLFEAARNSMNTAGVDTFGQLMRFKIGHFQEFVVTSVRVCFQVIRAQDWGEIQLSPHIPDEKKKTVIRWGIVGMVAAGFGLSIVVFAASVV